MMFYQAWPSRIVKALAEDGVERWDDLVQLSAVHLISKKGFSLGSLEFVCARLHEQGLVLADHGAEPRQPVSRVDLLGGIYFIGCQNFVKIGRARLVRKRLQDMQTLVPFTLSLLAVVPCEAAEAPALEASFHARFIAHRHLREWFRLEGALLAYLSTAGDPS